MRARFVLALAVISLPGLADAGALASGDEIRAVVSGNTVQGSLLASGDFTEFYREDGTILAKDYSGSWVVKGNQMCFTYGEDPETCWGVEIDGAQMVWVGEGGAEGTGTVISGNPNNY